MPASLAARPSVLHSGRRRAQGRRRAKPSLCSSPNDRRLQLQPVGGKVQDQPAPPHGLQNHAPVVPGPCARELQSQATTALHRCENDTGALPAFLRGELQCESVPLNSSKHHLLVCPQAFGCKLQCRTVLFDCGQEQCSVCAQLLSHTNQHAPVLLHRSERYVSIFANLRVCKQGVPINAHPSPCCSCHNHPVLLEAACRELQSRAVLDDR
mmetsp:Transcript_5723/g.13436  ORF Transcript_5723/g.13436 Transcript_5723/m.13436 type:complete len:211 (+) Transcript_5723:510-1142(+)